MDEQQQRQRVKSKVHPFFDADRRRRRGPRARGVDELVLELQPRNAELISLLACLVKRDVISLHREGGD